MTFLLLQSEIDKYGFGDLRFGHIEVTPKAVHVLCPRAGRVKLYKRMTHDKLCLFEGH